MKKKTKKTVFFKSIAVVAISSLLIFAVAKAAPPSSPYSPGETLDPACAPGDANCTIVAPAVSGSNSDITSLSGLTTALSVGQGGTGLSTIAANKLLYTSATDTLASLSLDSTLGINSGILSVQNNSITGAKIALGSDAQGDIMYYNGTDWARLGAGTSGQYLQTQGAGANPQWTTGATSIFGRTGDITAQANDYTWAQINKATSSLADIATRSAGDLSGGNLGIARMPLGGAWDITSDLNLESNTLFVGNAGGSYANRVGIGTATPGAALTIGSDAFTVTSAGAVTATTSITSPLVIGGTATTSDLILQTTSGVGASGADMHFLVGNNGGTEAMTILNSGYVGIGTTAPALKLSVVNGDVGQTSYLNSSSSWGVVVRKARGTAGSPLIVQNGDQLGLVAALGYDGSGFSESSNIHFEVEGTPGASTIPGLIQFNTKGTSGGIAERMRITNSGFVGIGTATPTDELHVAGQIYTTTGLHIGADSTNNLFDDGSNGAGSTTMYIGNASINVTASDVRLKENINPSTINALSIIDSMPVVDFDWKEGTKWYGRGRATGLIAQDMYDILPQVVDKPADPNNIWSVEYQHIVPYLIKGMQELTDENKILKTRIETLETRMGNNAPEEGIDPPTGGEEAELKLDNVENEILIEESAK